MKLGLSGSTIKSWFQYRCERKTRYDMMTRAERDSATIVKEESGAAWALEGDKFEERVLARLGKVEPVLGPGPNDNRLGQAATIAFATIIIPAYSPNTRFQSARERVGDGFDLFCGFGTASRDGSGVIQAADG